MFNLAEKEKRECQGLVDSLREMLDVRNVTIECLQKKVDELEMLCSSLKVSKGAAGHPLINLSVGLCIIPPLVCFRDR